MLSSALALTDPVPEIPLFLQIAPTRLISLNGVDIAIIVIYFAEVLAIGYYLKGQTATGEDFFLAGREMTAWIAGLSFLSANLGSLELMAEFMVKVPPRPINTVFSPRTGIGSARSPRCFSSAS